MHLEIRRGVDGNVYLLVDDYVLRNDRTINRGAATAAIDVDSGRARCSCVRVVGAVSGNEVTDDHVPAHVIRRQAKCRANVGMEGDSGQTVSCQFVLADHVARDTALAIAIGKKADSCASNLHAVGGGDILGHGIVDDAKVRSVRSGSVAHGRMGGKHDAAIERIVRDTVVNDQIVVAFRSLVADEDPICVAPH